MVCEKAMKKVLIAVPNMGWVHTSMVMSLVRILNDTRYEKLLLLPPPVRFTTIESVRQYIHHFFLKGAFDYLLSIDDDNAPIKNPLDLIELDKDMIGCVTPTWWYHSSVKDKKYPIRWNAYDRTFDKKLKKWRHDEHKPQKGLQKVDSIGMGCYLVARRVLEALKDVPVQSLVRDDGTTFKGEDIFFCERVREKGFEIYAHYDYSCMHIKELNLQDVHEGFQDYYKLT